MHNTTIALLIILLISECIPSERATINNSVNRDELSREYKALSSKRLGLSQQNPQAPRNIPPGSIGYVLLQVEGKIKNAPDPLASVLAIVPKGTWIPIFEERYDDYIKVQHGNVIGYLSIIYIDRMNIPDEVRKYLNIPKSEYQSSKYLQPEQSYTVKSNKTPTITHIGFEWNAFWNWGDCDLMADAENHARGTLKIIDDLYFDTDVSIQYSLKKKVVLRYTYTVIHDNLDNRVGPDLSYKYGDRYSPDYDWEETEYEYRASGSRNRSHIFSIGYPIRINDVDLSEYGFTGKYPLDIIFFGGISFTKNSKMDNYVWSDGFSDWYFADEYDYYIENRKTKKAIKLSYGISIPLGIQTSIFFTGHDWRILFGVGI